MDSQEVINMRGDLKRAHEALSYLQEALMADSMVLHPCKALSRDVVNHALVMAGFRPITDPEVTLI